MTVDIGNIINTIALGAGVYFLKMKVELEGKKTSTPEQVEELDRKVTELQKQVTALNVKVSKALPTDHRGPK